MIKAEHQIQKTDMADSYKHFPNLPPEQQAIRAKCFHPTGTFVEFEEEEIGQSIPGRFEKIVRIYSDHVAVKTKHQQITYDALNRTANRLARAILSRSEEGQQPVVLLLNDGISLSIATLAVFKTGNFVLGTNSLTSPATIARTFEESRAIIVTDSNNALMARDF